MAEILETIVRENVPLDVPLELRAMLHLRAGTGYAGRIRTARLSQKLSRNEKGHCHHS